MYMPPHFEEKRPEAMFELMREHPLGTLVTLDSNGLNANHIPFELDPEPAPFGTLRAHVARSNSVWREFSSEVDALIVFQGAQAYISPSWYATKQESGKVVPTWNYMVVHASGPLKIIDDPQWLRGLVGRLTERHEKGQAQPWKVADAPTDYIDKLLSAIVGIEIPVTRLVGKWKVSQNQPAVNREGIARGLQNAGAMAEAVRMKGNDPA
ncbi:FMN-binding negative transcriptional regulator [Noviherbaspirillum cavernae]|uniref:FMN-binding negative transcriptional regulator n=1 Tax=Noviherbaspirillum cavernae TaxID=2320862 RepID=A0A418X2B0_9BURK|nr:FMN-binding negative transcriptional regulator [Noviherbaspirillum cavernae]RJG06580.1 FMN-binding negative transcriptional regulator [Noviherbaspirillum cavernae]